MIKNKELKILYDTIDSDTFAMTFQSLGQYRKSIMNMIIELDKDNKMKDNIDGVSLFDDTNTRFTQRSS
jgi:hypothetical protein